MLMRCSLLASLLLVLPAAAQTLVKDLDLTPEPATLDSRPDGFLDAGGYALFGATEPATGYEPWISDGSAAGTVLLSEAWPGTGDGWFGGVALDSGLVLFVGESPGIGRELFRSDGTPGGTNLVLDIRPGSTGSDPTGLTSAGGLAFFFADDGVTGLELWASDGSAGGTYRVADLSAGSTIQSGLQADSGRAFFEADTGTGYRLWTSDGFTTTPLTAPLPQPTIQNLRPFSGGAFFRNDDPVRGEEVWFTDATVASTGPVSGAVVGGGGFSPRRLRLFGSTLYYRASSNGGSQLWKTDGTPGGTALVADTLPSGLAKPTALGPVAGGVVFSSNRTPQGDRDLYWTDGTPGSFTQISSVDVELSMSEPGELMGGYLYFPGDGGNGVELWRTDGTAAGTTEVASIRPGTEGAEVQNLSVIGGRLYFSADDGVAGLEPWVSDGSAAGTLQLANIAPEALTRGSQPDVLGAFGDLVVFQADAGTGEGQELWISDGTDAGTVSLGDLDPGPGGIGAKGFASTSSYFFFVCSAGSSGFEPWVSDGTPAGTFQLGELRPGIASGAQGVSTEFEDRVLFAGGDAAFGTELWTTDGTSAGTELLADLNPGPSSTVMTTFVEWRGKVYFVANAGSGYELHVTDGTTAGSGLVVELRPGILGGFDSLAEPLVAFGDHLYFAARGPEGGRELWRSDGTAAGTELFADLNPGVGNSNPDSLAVVDGALLFFAHDGFARSLFRTDGAGPPQLVTTLSLLDQGDLQPLDDVAVFWARDATTPGQIWSTDGTAAGTGPLLVFEPTGGVPQTVIFTRVGESRLLFSANDRVHGDEVWVTDGTAAGTQLVVDIGLGDATPRDLVRAGSQVFLAAFDQVHGRELHAFALADAGEWAMELYGKGCPGTGGLVPRISLTGTIQASAPSPAAIELADARPNATALLMWSPRRSYTLLAPGCGVLLGPPVRYIVTSTDGSGTGSLSFTPNPAMIGFDAHFQWAVLDPLGAYNNRVSFSAGMELVGGP